jgi:SAM-dependent methyltransferase
VPGADSLTGRVRLNCVAALNQSYPLQMSKRSLLSGGSATYPTSPSSFALLRPLPGSHRAARTLNSISNHPGGETWWVYGAAVSASSDRWERFAKENAEFYIYTLPGVDFATSAGQAVFRQTGRDDVDLILEECKAHLNGFGRAIDIGCGVGRLAMPMAERFTEVIGVDISPTMISKLRDYCRDAGTANIRGFLAHEPWSEHGPADLIYSLIVFHHIEDWSIIADYFARVANCLADNGVCYTQFDTRRRTLPYFALRLLPDFVLPAPFRKGVRRVRRRPVDLRRLFDSCALTVLDEFRPDTDYHAFVLRHRT